MKRKGLVMLIASVMFLSFGIKANAAIDKQELKQELLKKALIEEAVEAGEEADFEKAYNLYGHAFWEGSMDAKREMDNILKSDRDKEIYNFKYDRQCPVSKDNVKTNHIRLFDGTILKDESKVKVSDLKNASIVFNDKKLLEDTDYYIYFISSDYKYDIATDTCFDFAIDMAIEKGHEYKLSDVANMFNKYNKYTHLSIGFIDKESYDAGKLPEFIDFTIER